jgi:hypothetical protein
MNREEFKSLSSQLKKGSLVHLKLTDPRLDIPDEFTAKIHDRGPSFIEVGIKGIRGLRKFLFTQVESLVIEEQKK